MIAAWCTASHDTPLQSLTNPRKCTRPFLLFALANIFTRFGLVWKFFSSIALLMATMSYAELTIRVEAAAYTLPGKLLCLFL